ncbi:hypothetical protein HYDPIDRAFT_89842, partial [Hydnomerulius pinastri MD-312]
MPISSTSVNASSSSNSVVSKSGSRLAPIQTYEGHEGSVLCVTFFQGEQRLVTGSWDGGVRVWNRETGAQIGHALKAHTNVVNAVDVSPDGRTIASGSEDRMVRIWYAETEGLLRILGHEGTVTSVHISPDSKRVASGSRDGRLTVWDSSTGDHIRTWKAHDNLITSLSLSPNGTHLATCTRFEKVAFVFDVTTGERSRPAPIQTYEGHESLISCVAFFQDEQRLVTGSVDGDVRVWHRETGAQIGNPLKGHTKTVHMVDVSPDGRTIASGSYDKTVRIWDAATEELLHTL